MVVDNGMLTFLRVSVGLPPKHMQGAAGAAVVVRLFDAYSAPEESNDGSCLLRYYR
jgi:hypothetical protein